MAVSGRYNQLGELRRNGAVVIFALAAMLIAATAWQAILHFRDAQEVSFGESLLAISIRHSFRASFPHGWRLTRSIPHDQ